jgi:hypothetical protein
LLIPPNDIYADYATAAAAIADLTSGCVAYYLPNGTTGNSISASFDGTTLAITTTTDGVYDAGGARYDCIVDTYFSVALKAGATITIPITCSSGFVDYTMTAYLYDCDGVEIDSDGNTDPESPTATLTLTATVDGVYSVHLMTWGINTSSPLNFQTDTSITCDDVFWVNPVIALWDDSGTTRQLEACPKMIIPFPEFTGAWYGDEAAAQDAIDQFTVDCELYVDVDVSTPGYSASLSGTDIDMLLEVSDDCVPQETLFGAISVNLVGGDIITVSAASVSSYYIPPEGECPTCNPDFPDECDAFQVSVSVNTPDGATIVFGDSSESTSLSQSAGGSFTVPYTGRFIFSVGGGRGNSQWTQCCLDSVHVTASLSGGTISVNPIQALYDVGLDCPARLDCT